MAVTARFLSGPLPEAIHRSQFNAIKAPPIGWYHGSHDISERTKAALAAARRRAVQLGEYNKNPKLTALARKSGQEANARVAAERASVVGPVIAELQTAGATSLRAIAMGLNERGVPTARGTGTWSATQVMRVLARR